MKLNELRIQKNDYNDIQNVELQSSSEEFTAPQINNGSEKKITKSKWAEYLDENELTDDDDELFHDNNTTNKLCHNNINKTSDVKKEKLNIFDTFDKNKLNNDNELKNNSYRINDLDCTISKNDETENLMDAEKNSDFFTDFIDECNKKRQSDEQLNVGKIKKIKNFNEKSEIEKKYIFKFDSNDLDDIINISF